MGGRNSILPGNGRGACIVVAVSVGAACEERNNAHLDYNAWRTAMLTCHSFQYIIRLLNTNVDGKQKVMYALTKIKGVGRRYSNLVCKKADVDLTKRAGDLTSEELERIVTIIQNPLQCTFEISHLSILTSDTHQTRSPPGSSTGSATLSTARTLRSSPTVSTPSSVRTSSASRRSALTVVSVTTGASASVVSTPRPPVVAAGPSVSPRRRAKYYALPAGVSNRLVLVCIKALRNGWCTIGVLRHSLAAICTSYGLRWTAIRTGSNQPVPKIIPTISSSICLLMPISRTPSPPCSMLISAPSTYAMHLEVSDWYHDATQPHRTFDTTASLFGSGKCSLRPQPLKSRQLLPRRIMRGPTCVIRLHSSESIYANAYCANDGTNFHHAKFAFCHFARMWIS